MAKRDPSTFGNDTASDWSYDLEENDDLSLIEATLQDVYGAEPGDYIEAPDAEAAVAAAEVLAWLLGKPGNESSSTEKIAAWVESHALQPSPALLKKAVAVLDRIEGENSELAEKWADNDEWTAVMSDLRTRLTA